jgi:hypothetical protein
MFCKLAEVLGVEVGGVRRTPGNIDFVDGSGTTEEEAEEG